MWTGLMWRRITSCGHDIEPLDCVTGGTFLDKLNECRHLDVVVICDLDYPVTLFKVVLQS